MQSSKIKMKEETLLLTLEKSKNLQGNTLYSLEQSYADKTDNLVEMDLETTNF